MSYAEDYTTQKRGGHHQETGRRATGRKKVRKEGRREGRKEGQYLTALF
jgi:hypothetical protein